MREPNEKITLDPDPFRVGDVWYVQAILPDGRMYPIDGFKSETQAREWIANRSKLWFREEPQGGRTDPPRTPYLDLAEILARPISLPPPSQTKAIKPEDRSSRAWSERSHDPG